MVYRTSRYDLVIFGATGFVGRILCQYLLDQVGVNGSVKWAIAGRSQTKLNTLVSTLGANNLPQIVADGAVGLILFRRIWVCIICSSRRKSGLEEFAIVSKCA